MHLLTYLLTCLHWLQILKLVGGSACYDTVGWVMGRQSLMQLLLERFCASVTEPRVQQLC